MTLRLAAVLAASGIACGEAQQNWSCDNRDLSSTCSEWIAPHTRDEVEGSCDGELQLGGCPEEGAVGRCIVDGDPLETVFYADGPEPYDASAAEVACDEVGGTFQG